MQGTTLRRVAAAAGLSGWLMVPACAATTVLAAPAPVAPTPGQVVDPIACEKFPDQSYALFLPAAYSAEKKWPVLYAFDARRHGKLVADLYRDAAERFGWIVVSSNNARSDEAMDPNLEAMKAMWEDSHARFSIDPRRVYGTGYSGGARAACVLAMVRKGEVAGVIGHGGGFPFQWPPTKDVAFAFFGLAGDRDFNFPELLRLDRSLSELGLQHHFESFAGEHEWAPPAEAMLSLGWMELLAMQAGTAPRRATVIAELWADFDARARRMLAAGDPVAAAREHAAMLRSFAGLQGDAALGAVRQALATLEAAPETARARQAQQRVEDEQAAYLLRAQARIQQFLAQDPAEFDPVLAARALEITRVTKLARTARSEYERLAALRSVATLFGQTIFYMPTALIARNDFGHAAIVVEIASLLRPDSVNAWFTLAAVRAQAGWASAAIAALRKATTTGRVEARWLAGDQRFDSLRGRKDFQALLAALSRQPEAPLGSGSTAQAADHLTISSPFMPPL